MSELLGQNVGRYHVIEQLGEGGMATVFKAYDTRLERNVALKVIRSNQVQDELFLKRFEREAKALAQLSHPNIVKVLDYGDFNGQPYLVMEYISGGTLKQKLGTPMTPQQAARILAPMAHALGYAHQHKIVHRDVKPANILLTDSGEPMLSDFGIAKMLERQDNIELTGAGVGIGTPEYMAPEQGLGSKIDHRADVYALGIVLFELVTGRKPFQADTPMAVVVKQINEPLPRPRELISSLPDAVEKIIFKALQKRPEDRFQDMESFASAMESLEAPQISTDSTNALPSSGSTRVYSPQEEPMPSVVYNFPTPAPSVSAPVSNPTPVQPQYQAPVYRQAAAPYPSTPYQQAVLAPKPQKISPIIWVIGGVVLLGLCGLLIVGGFFLLQGGDSLGLFSPSETLIPTRTETDIPSETPEPEPTMTMTPEIIYSPTDYPIVTGNVFTDDFTDPNSGWEVGSYDTGSIGYGDGYYFVSSTVKNKSMWGAYLNEVYSDTMVLVNSTQYDSPANNNNDYGIMCRVQDNGDGYSLLISGDGFYSIQVSNSGSFTSLVEWTKSDLINQGAASNFFEADCIGSTLSLYVNGSLLTTIEDSSFSSGKIGLTATTYEDAAVEIHFSNLTISPY